MREMDVCCLLLWSWSALELSWRPHSICHGCVCGPDPKAADNYVDESDQEDGDDNDVIDDVGRALVTFIIDVQTSHNQKENAN